MGYHGIANLRDSGIKMRHSEYGEGTELRLPIFEMLIAIFIGVGTFFFIFFLFREGTSSIKKEGSVPIEFLSASRQGDIEKDIKRKRAKLGTRWWKWIESPQHTPRHVREPVCIVRLRVDISFWMGRQTFTPISDPSLSKSTTPEPTSRDLGVGKGRMKKEIWRKFSLEQKILDREEKKLFCDESKFDIDRNPGIATKSTLPKYTLSVSKPACPLLIQIVIHL